MLKQKKVRVLFLMCGLLLSVNVFATIPQMIDFQGRLSNASGDPLTGAYQFVFKIYDGETGGTALWSETQDNVQITNGVYNVKIGTVTAIPIGVFENSNINRWLQIIIGGETMSPRVRLISVPYSFISERAYGVIGATITASNLANNIDASGIGFNADLLDGKHYTAFVSTAGNAMMNGPLTIANVAGSTLTFNLGNTYYGLQTDLGNNFLRFNSGWNFDWWNLGSSTKTMFLDSDGVLSTRRDINVGLPSMGSSGKLVLWGSGNLNWNGDGNFCLARSNNWITLTVWDGFQIWSSKIGASTKTLEIDYLGNLGTNGNITANAWDLAELFPVSDTNIEAGDVVVADEIHHGTLKISDTVYDKKVIGIVSTKPGFILKGKSIDDSINSVERLIAMSGRVPCKVTTINGAIEVGDLLTTSSIPGYAMKATDRDKSWGAIIGKALEPLPSGEGKIMVFVNVK